MKALFENIPLDKGNSSVHAYRFEVPYFEFKWHYHPEWELTYIVKGSGYRLIGNTLEDFNAGDFVLIGKNVPHTWCSKAQDDEPVEAIVIQFGTASLESVLAMPESESVQSLLSQASRGLHLQDSKPWECKVLALTQTEGFDRVVGLLALLHAISKARYRAICPNNHHTIVSPKQELRINTVCQYISEHYKEPISLSRVADLVFMTESNFCKFFKKATGKTFSDYVNEMRIQAACQLLRESEIKISTLAQECGFETLSYFNRVFLAKKKCSPKQYRNSSY
jgi:AraC-like DNA-binding protein/mannose-6-phosphate isomerase-like protein (cupin superfamily)